MSIKSLAPSIGMFVLLVTPVRSHDLADGFVERAVQVRIRDNVLRIEYAIGLTEPTMAQILGEIPDCGVRCDGERSSDAMAGGVRDRFKRFTANSLADALELTIGGERQRLMMESVDEYAKHHYDFVAHLECKLSLMSTGRGARFILQDSNFSDLDGAVRYALKSTGSAMITRTDTAPILIRSLRHELGTLNPDERHNVCQIQASIAVLKLGPKD